MKFLLRLCIVCITIVGVVHFQNWQIWSSAESLDQTCTTTECFKLGKVYLENMNLSVDPCSNFYDFVCHNWAIHNPRPKEITGQFLWTIAQSHDFNALLQMKKLLESSDTPRSTELDKAKFLYKTCMDMPLMPRKKPNVARNITRQISSFPFLIPPNIPIPPQPPIWEIVRRYMKLTGESALFDFKMQLSLTFPYDIITKLKAPSSPYGALYRTTEWLNPIELKNYEAFISKAIRSLVEPDHPFSREQIQIQTEEVLRFRKELGLSIALEDYAKEKNEPVTIKQFQFWYNTKSKSNTTAQINWLEMIRAIYTNWDDTRSSRITENSKIKPRSYQYFTQLANLLKRTPERAIVNHIHLYFLERHLELNSEMQANLDNSVTLNGVDSSGEVATGPQRWMSCLANRFLKQLLGKAYVNSAFTKNDKSKVLGFLQKGKELLQQVIKDSPWLDSRIKLDSTHKVKKMTGAIGYPDSYDSDKLLTTNTEDIVALKPDAHYDNDLNRVAVTAAYLQTPIYTPNVPYVIDYGATFNVLGHELYHAFDVDGINSDENGNIPWWPKEMVKEHQERTKCFTQQFAQYKEEEYKKIKGHPPSGVKFLPTLDEDISDVMGLKLSYLGFKEMLKQKNGVCPVLPGFQKFGCEKLFFIAYANTFCTEIINHQQEVLLINGLYSLPQTRVNGAVANMKEFRTAFGCKPVDPKLTCDLWK